MSNDRRIPRELTDAEEAAAQAAIASDPENPEWTDEDFANARPAAEVLPPALYAALTREPRSEPAKRGRPKAAEPKIAVTVRLDPVIVRHFKATGPGWQTRMNDTLIEVVQWRATDTYHVERVRSPHPVTTVTRKGATRRRAAKDKLIPSRA